MSNKTCCDEFKMWLPLIIISAIVVGVPIALGSDLVIVLAVWGGIMLLFILMFWYVGKIFNYGWFRASCKTQRRLDNQWAIVTGANSGAGYETAKELIRRGCNVIITCRSEAKAKTTILNIEKDLHDANSNSENNKSSLQGGNYKGKIDYAIMDLGSKESVDNGINTILSKNVGISILINNAGAVLRSYKLSKDNIELMWQANYLSPLYLTEKLLPNIKQTAQTLKFGRIVNVASLAHQNATQENFDAFMSADKRGDLSFWEPQNTSKVYGDTKCAQMCYTRSLQELLNSEKDSSGESFGKYIWVTCLHPGFINSGFYRPGEFGLVMRCIWSFIYPFQSTFAMISPKQGAQTSLHCALSDEKVNPGGYHGHCEPQDPSAKAVPVMDENYKRLYDVSKAIWPIEFNQV